MAGFRFGFSGERSKQKVGIGQATGATMMNMPDSHEPAGSTADGKAASHSSSSNDSSSPVKVWLVDDNAEIRQVLAEALDSFKDIRCERHFSGPDALLSELASKPGPDVILLDVQMGDRNGLDAVRPIKSLTRSTRVLMFTTCFNSKWREQALSDGASDYLLKSCALHHMAERIRCSAHDPAPGTYPRRRIKRSAEKPESVIAAKTLPGKPKRFLKRTMNLLLNGWPVRHTGFDQAGRG